MSKVETTATVTRPYLMGKTKSELCDLVFEYMDSRESHAQARIREAVLDVLAEIDSVNEIEVPLRRELQYGLIRVSLRMGYAWKTESERVRSKIEFIRGRYP